MLVALAGCSSGQEPKLTVFAFSAGAADAFLITTRDSAVLIDCGEKSFGKEIADYLKERGITRLDYLIITHFDKDHVGGAEKVIRSVDIDHVLQSDYPKESNAYGNYLEALAAVEIEAETVTEDLSFSLDGVQYRIDAPAGGYSSDASNNSSLIVSITNGRDRLLFMGDAEDERIAEFLDQKPGTYDFLKVPHHGRSGELSALLIGTVRPRIAVITSSESEPEDRDVVRCLEESGANCYLTRNGPVLIESTGDGLRAGYA
jgi:beta-lactamase superfamily II metal-dependent hydrolase